MNPDAFRTATEGVAWMTAVSLFLVFAYLAGVFATSIYCACKTQKDDRVPWILITIFVPFGWIGFWMFGPAAETLAIQPSSIPLSTPNQTEKDIAARVLEGLKNDKTRRQH